MAVIRGTRLAWEAAKSGILSSYLQGCTAEREGAVYVGREREL
jgi:hypothetical protein